jgi:NADPH:quinone reductase
MSTTDSNAVVSTSRQLHSLVTADGTLRLSIAEVNLGPVGSSDVIVQVQATPLNPSDLGLLFAGADMAAATSSGTGDGVVVSAPMSAAAMAAARARVGQPSPVGNEGAGVVIAAGDAPEAQALLGRTVAVLGGAMYSDYRRVHVSQCLDLPDGTPASAAASCFVNPLTALCMVETMRAEGHHGLVHTAAASNLGRMLNKLCLNENIELVNIVRKPEQADVLRAIGAKHIVDSSSATFTDDLVAALSATGATLAFDAIGGGPLAGQILGAMEAAAVAKMDGFSRYGSTTHKQVYIYGGLDRRPTELVRNFGMAWGLGGWLLTPMMAKLGALRMGELRAKVAAEITTTFASSYTKTVSLTGALDLAEIAVYGRQSTGDKYLINPSMG